jgi:hypothetical protein
MPPFGGTARAGYLRDEVRRAINRRSGDRVHADKQLDLPGFAREHLQDFYICERDGEEVAVPVLAMTRAELAAKAAFHRALGNTNHAVADEIERFVIYRFGEEEPAPAEGGAGGDETARAA